MVQKVNKIVFGLIMSLVVCVSNSIAMDLTYRNRTENDDVIFSQSFWENEISSLECLLAEKPNQVDSNAEIAALVREIAETSHSKRKLQQDFGMIRCYIIPSINKYKADFPHEKIALKMIQRYIKTVRPFEKGNVVELWSMLKRIHPLTEQNAQAIFQTITTTNFEPFYPDGARPLWDFKVVDHYIPSSWNLIPRDENSNFHIAKETILEGVFSDSKNLEGIISNIPSKHISFFYDILLKYYVARYPVINEMPNVLSNNEPCLHSLAQRVVLEKIRQALLKHDNVPYLLELLLEVLK